MAKSRFAEALGSNRATSYFRGQRMASKEQQQRTSCSCAVARRSSESARKGCWMAADSSSTRIICCRVVRLVAMCSIVDVLVVPLH